MKYLQAILPYLKNKYVITITLFLMWMLFFDRHDIISQIQLKRQLNRIEDERAFYHEMIKEINASNEELFTSDETLEKFAREKYLMKRDNEDVFLIIEKDKE